MRRGTGTSQWVLSFSYAIYTSSRNPPYRLLHIVNKMVLCTLKYMKRIGLMLSVLTTRITNTKAYKNVF